jgi:hypothetical protein
MDITNLNRAIGLRGTKANVEAFSATLEEQAIAYATDTAQIGIYTNGAWVWQGTTFSDSEGDPADVTTGSAADGTSTYAARRDHVHHIASASGRFQPLANGNPSAPALVFTPDGDVIMVPF